MSYNNTGAFTASKCLNELMQLTDVAGYSQAKKRSKLGYLEAINSPLNMSQQSQIPVQNGSKKRVVELRWRQRTIETQVFTSASGTCTSDNYDDFNSELFEVDKIVEYKFALNTQEFKAVCEGRSKFISDSLENSYDALARVINKEL